MRWFRAPAKINLSLRVLARRSDGLHEIESLVAFAEIGDWLGYAPGPSLVLEVEGPAATEAGPPEENLVLRAAHALAARIPDLTLGRFRLVKRLPAAAGMGGGSSDAAAALAALAEANGLPEQDERLRAAASQTGADVPVCLFPKARMMSGIGERLGAPVALPEVFAVLANPRVPAPTREVFEALGLAPGARLEPAGGPEGVRPCALSRGETPPVRRVRVLAHPGGGDAAPPDFLPDSKAPVTLGMLTSGRNDLEEAARRVAPAIGSALETLARLPGALAARMSGSGATCFALFDNALAAAAAQRLVVAEQPQWWVRATRLR